jgi:hypothetical protein
MLNCFPPRQLKRPQHEQRSFLLLRSVRRSDAGIYCVGDFMKFIFDYFLIVACVTGLLFMCGAMEKYDAEQAAKNKARIAAEQSQQAALRRAEWVLLMDKGEMMTTFKAVMR